MKYLSIFDTRIIVNLYLYKSTMRYSWLIELKNLKKLANPLAIVTRA